VIAFLKSLNSEYYFEVTFLRIVRRKGEKGGENEKGFINILSIFKQKLALLFAFDYKVPLWHKRKGIYAL
jgi:hypothetical protein